MNARNDQINDKATEIEKLKQQMLTGEEKVAALRDEYIHLQNTLKTELAKQESVLSQEKQQTQWMDALRSDLLPLPSTVVRASLASRKENAQLQEHVRLLTAENLDAQKKRNDWELLRASLMKTVDELRAEIASLSHKNLRNCRKMKGASSSMHLSSLIDG